MPSLGHPDYSQSSPRQRAINMKLHRLLMATNVEAETVRKSDMRILTIQRADPKEV